MMKSWVTILLFSGWVNAKTFHPEMTEVTESGILKKPVYSVHGISVPVVRLYSINGEIKKEIYGDDIYNLNSYDLIREPYTKINHKIDKIKGLNNLNEILDYFKIKKPTDKPVLMYIDVEKDCPPCTRILVEFKKRILNDLSKNHTVFFIRFHKK